MFNLKPLKEYNIQQQIIITEMENNNNNVTKTIITAMEKGS